MKLHSSPLSLLLLRSIHKTHARVGTSAISLHKEEDIGKLRYARITSNSNNGCLRTSYTQDGQEESSYEVKIVPCTVDSDELWDYDSKNYVMKHVISGYCLDGRKGVKIRKCKDSANLKAKTQRWQVDDKHRLVNFNPVIRPMLCMRINTGLENLSLKVCDDELDSKFTLTKPSTLRWKGMILNVLRHECVQSSSKNQVYIDVCRKGKNKYWSYDFKNQMIKNQATGRCIDASDDSIAMSICSKSNDNQKWTLDNKGRVVSDKNGLCIGVISRETNELKLGNCRNRDRQQFKMISRSDIDI